MLHKWSIIVRVVGEDNVISIDWITPVRWSERYSFNGCLVSNTSYRRQRRRNTGPKGRILKSPWRIRLLKGEKGGNRRRPNNKHQNKKWNPNKREAPNQYNKDLFRDHYNLWKSQHPIQATVFFSYLYTFSDTIVIGWLVARDFIFSDTIIIGWLIAGNLFSCCTFTPLPRMWTTTDSLWALYNWHHGLFPFEESYKFREHW